MSILAANITQPQGAICGTFNLIVSLEKSVEALTDANIALSGDTDGVSWTILGDGCCWTVRFALPEDAAGRLSIGLTGAVVLADTEERVDLEQVRVDLDYNTCERVKGLWLAPVYEGRQVKVGLALSEAVVGLSRRSFRVDMGQWDVKMQVVGLSEDGTYYEVRLRPPRSFGSSRGIISVSLDKAVLTAEGTEINIEIDPLQVEYPRPEEV